MDLKIRDATPDDAAGIVGVFNPIIEAGCFTVFDTPFTVEAERSYLANLKERDIFHVALRVDDNSVVGFQSMEPFAAYSHAFDHVGILGTYVDLGSRRQGVAKRLFEVTFEAARCSATKSFSLTSVPTIQVPSLPTRTKASGSSERRIDR